MLLELLVDWMEFVVQRWVPNLIASARQNGGVRSHTVWRDADGG